MQNAQNAAEIQQRVINLVELYRTKVGKESQIAKDAKADCDYWDQESINLMDENGIGGGIYGEGPHIEDWIKHLMVNEQLLGHFYSLVAGKDAEKEILDQLQPDVYDKTIFTEEEELFLTAHFKDMVNYIILTPCDDSLEWVHRHDGKDAYTIPKEVLELVKARVEIPIGSTVYYPHTAFAQLANLFDGCKYYCDTMFYAWTKVALYANNIDAENNARPTSYDAIVSYLPKDDDDSKAIARLCDAYKNLPVGGKFVLICPPNVLVNKENTLYRRTLSETLKYKGLPSVKEKLEEASTDVNAQFRRMLVEDKAIKEIIQLPSVMSNNASFDAYCLLIAEKGRIKSDTLLVDARVASNDFDTKHYILSFDNTKFNAILQNDGIDSSTGLRKVVNVSSEDLSSEILIPQVYVIERPTETEHPVPLSMLCSLASTRVRDVQFDLPEDTPWITKSDLTPLYTGDLDMSVIRKADCPNNPPYVEGSKEYGFDKDGKFVDSIWSQIGKSKGHDVLEYRRCTYLDGNSDAVLYERFAESGIQIAVVRATGKPYAVSSGIFVFCPKDDFDANSLVALLRLPVVYRQLIAYQEYGLGNYLNEILVPMDKRIIGDELYRMKREEAVTNELGEKVLVMKTEYINEVRMRKHDMRPHMKQLNSSKNLMQHYVDNMSTIDDVQIHLNHQLARFSDALGHLSDIIEHLSDEEKFGKPERFPIIEHLQELITEFNRSGYNISFNYKEDEAKEYLKNKIEYFLDNIKDFETEKGEYPFPIHFSYALIAPLDFDRMVQNIIENARTHGFIDASKSDYKIWINLDIDEKRDMYQIDFSNNGMPLPEGMTKARYGIKGEKAGKHAGTGSGGYIVKSIVTHYGGDYDIFCKNGITTVRILLPIVTI
ncbi:MAG: hypothetical protein IJ190_06705 [Prevotella sp.]|nr:hypothetical protein [Prevotella sp.]